MSIDEVPGPSTGVKSPDFFKSFVTTIFSFFKRKQKLESLSQRFANAITESDMISDLEQKNIILNMANLADGRVEDIMTPRTDIEAISLQSCVNDVKNAMIKTNHMRIPVYNDSLDHIKGFVHMKDIIRLVTEEESSIEKIIKPILFVPPSMKVLDLLVKMRTKRINIAIVVDEYGGTDGLVTLEDLFEKVLGNIEESEIEVIDDKRFEVNARIRIEDLEQKLDIRLSDLADRDEYDTLAGFLMSVTNKIPGVGEVIEHESGIKFYIKDATPRFIKTVVVEL